MKNLLFSLVSLFLTRILCKSVSFDGILLPSLLNEASLNALLPSVYIVPMDDTFNIKCHYFEEKEKWQIHEKDVLFHRWLRNHYSKTVNKSEDAYFYFLPVYSFICQNRAFNRMDKLLESYINTENNNKQVFALDRTFIIISHPTDSPQPYSHQVNMLSIRILRVDNYRSFNGRDSFIPYTVNITEFITPEVEKRRNFIFAPCNKGPADMDNSREFRRKPCEVWKDTPDSLISSRKISSQDFNRAMRRSDFCVILPGDTPGTAKLYKAIFSGCIPVYFVSSKAQLPFSRFLNWNKFAVIVQKETIHNEKMMMALSRYLFNIRNSDKLIEMQENLKKVRVLFDFDNFLWPSVYHLMLLDLVFTSGCGVKKSIFSSNLQQLNIDEQSNNNAAFKSFRKYIC